MTTIAEARRIVELADSILQREASITRMEGDLESSKRALKLAEAELDRLTTGTPPFKVGDEVTNYSTGKSLKIEHIWKSDEGIWKIRSFYSGKVYDTEGFRIS